MKRDMARTDKVLKSLVYSIVLMLSFCGFAYMVFSSYDNDPVKGSDLRISTEEVKYYPEGSAILNGKLVDLGSYDRIDVKFRWINMESPLQGNFTLDQFIIDDTIDEGDGLSVADINGDGKLDPIVGTGKGGSVHWYELKGPDDWKKHLIVNDLVEVEGTSTADFDGDGSEEVIILDQATDNEGAPNVYIAKMGDTYDNWTLEVLDDDAPHVQQALVFDVDNDDDPDFVYAYEGRKNGEGGFYWMEYKGGDVLESANWEKHEIDQVEGAWWIDFNSPKDWGGKGSGDIAVGVRSGPRSPPSAKGGVFIYRQPTDPRDRWEKITVDDSYPVLQVVSGDMTRSGEETDLIAGACHDSDDEGLYIYDHKDNWSKRVVKSDHDWWGTYAYDVDQDGMFEIISGDRTTKEMKLFVYSEIESSYLSIRTIPFDKPDDQIIFADINGDGTITEFFAGSDAEKRLSWFNVFKTSRSNWKETDQETLTDIGVFQHTIQGLEMNATYIFKAVAYDAETGELLAEGEWVQFMTIATDGIMIIQYGNSLQ